MPYYAVYETATGRLTSLGTVLSGALPTGYSSKEYGTDPNPDGVKVWDPVTLDFVAGTASRIVTVRKFLGFFLYKELEAIIPGPTGVGDADAAKWWELFKSCTGDNIVDLNDVLLMSGLLFLGSSPVPGGSGTATNGGTKTLEDTAQTWAVDQWFNWRVQIVAGAGAGEIKVIKSNTAIELTTEVSWTVAPDTTSQYEIIGKGIVSVATYDAIQAYGT